MTRWPAFFGMLAATMMSIFAADPLPKSDTDESFEIEPPLLIPNRDGEKFNRAEASAKPAPISDPDKLEKNLERAKKSAAGAERLFKIGAIAKMEAEQRTLRVVRLEADLADARLTLAKEAIMQQKTREAEVALAQAIEAAHTAVANRDRAELAFAESNLHRQQKLLALGSGHKSNVDRAEQKLADLKAPKEN